MSTEIIVALIGTLTTIISWFLARKKYTSEVDKSNIDNMQEALEFYQNLSDDTKKRLDEVLARNDALEKEVAELRKQVFELMQSICYNLTCKLRETEPGTNKKVKPIKVKSNGVEGSKSIQKK